MNRVKRLAKIIFGIPLTIISFIFIGKIFVDSWSEISHLLQNANLTLIFIGTFFMLLFFLFRSFVWIKILKLYEKNTTPVSKQIYDYTLAETKRYIPGNIFSFVSRVQKFKSHTLSHKKLIFALVLESIIMVLSACVVSIPGVFKLINLQTPDNNILLLAIVPILIFLVIVFFLKSKIQKLIFSVLPTFNKIDILNIIDIFFVSVITWVCFGIANFIFASSLFANNPNDIIILSSLFAFSWLLGYLSFVAPMGIGVREAAIIFLLSPFVPSYAATAIAVFTRITMIGSEVLFLSLIYIFDRFKSKFLKFKFSASEIIVGAFGFLYMTYFTFTSIVKHSNFFTGKFDLGNMEQTVWNTLHSRLFLFSNPDGTTEISRLSAHSDFILILITPFYALYQSANTLLIIQSLVLGLGGFFVYLIAKQIIKSNRLAVILAASYYLNYFVQEQNLFDFHSVTLATTFLLGGFYFLLVKKYRLVALMLTLAVLTKENVFLVTTIFGGYIYLNINKRWGIIVSSFSALSFLLLMTYFIPQARSGEHFALEYLSYLGNSPAEIILSPILKPVVFFSRVFSPESLNYLVSVLLPTGFISLSSPAFLIFALPDFLINILSDNPHLRSIQYHYGALLVPFVYISTIFGIRKILRKNNSVFTKRLIFYYLLFFSTYTTWNYSPIIGMKNSDNSAFARIDNKELIYQKLTEIPDDAIVSATNSIAAQLVQREKIYVFPYGKEFADYLVFYGNLEDAKSLLSTDSGFAKTTELSNFMILKRINSSKVDTP